MRLLLVLIITILASCSNNNKIEVNHINFEFSDEAISNSNQTQLQVKNYLLKNDADLSGEIFTKSWISEIQTTQTFDSELLVKIKEHQPIASIRKGGFITQAGKLVFPGEGAKQLNLISIFGLESDSTFLLDNAFSLQDILNLKGNSVISIENMGSDFLAYYDNEGIKYSFTQRDFRVQLERLEQFILFELNSGMKDNIKYIDLRYRNAIAVGNERVEKSI